MFLEILFEQNRKKTTAFYFTIDAYGLKAFRSQLKYKETPCFGICFFLNQAAGKLMNLLLKKLCSLRYIDSKVLFKI